VLPACCSTKTTKLKIAIVAADDGMLRRYFIDVLESAGYEVLPAAEAGNVLDLLESRPDAGFLVMNFQSLRIDGFALARQAKERQPDIGVLYISSCSRSEVTRSAVPGSCYLPEPCAPSVLLNALSLMANDDGSAPARLANLGGDGVTCAYRLAGV
jgi:CheY-like chemotaxis protein